MKKIVKQPIKKNYNPLLEDNAIDEHFVAHFLSPLETAAFKADFTTFKYNLGTVPITISTALAQEILNFSVSKLRFFTGFVMKVQKDMLFTDAKFETFLNAPLNNHKLNTRLYHCLHGYQCETLFDVLSLGKKGTKGIKGIGDEGMKELTVLFKKNGCSKLFI